MERLAEFAPAILSMVLVAALTWMCVRYLTKKLWAENYDSVAWHQENSKRVTWTIGVLRPYIWAPTAEELLFRVALVVIFPTMTTTAWKWVIISSILFGVVHWFGKHVSISDLIEARKDNEHESDSVKAEVERIYAKHKTRYRAIKAIHIVLPTFGGVGIAYMGITHQSIWLMSGMHMAWNLLAPLAVVLIGAAGLLIYVGLGYIWKKIKPAKNKPAPEHVHDSDSEPCTCCPVAA